MQKVSRSLLLLFEITLRKLNSVLTIQYCMRLYIRTHYSATGWKVHLESGRPVFQFLLRDLSNVI